MRHDPERGVPRAGEIKSRKALSCAADPLDCDPGDLERLKGYGLTEEEVWDVVEIASMYNFTNRMSLACGMIPNEEYHALAR